MKIKILSSYPKKTFEVSNLFFSSDLHLRHQAVVNFGRNFKDLEQMNTHIISEINKKVGKDDIIVLLGDTIMVDKDYAWFLDSIICENVILLFGNHCGVGRLTEIKNSYQFDKLKYIGYYLELSVDKQIVCCSHYPMFNWNYQDEGSFHLSGHLHGDENHIIELMRKYKCMDVGIDSYYNMFGEYSVFSFEQICEILKDKKIIGRHEINK